MEINLGELTLNVNGVEAKSAPAEFSVVVPSKEKTKDEIGRNLLKGCTVSVNQYKILF